MADLAKSPLEYFLSATKVGISHSPPVLEIRVLKTDSSEKTNEFVEQNRPAYLLAFKRPFTVQQNASFDNRKLESENCCLKMRYGSELDISKSSQLLVGKPDSENRTRCCLGKEHGSKLAIPLISGGGA